MDDFVETILTMGAILTIATLWCSEAACFMSFSLIDEGRPTR